MSDVGHWPASGPRQPAGAPHPSGTTFTSNELAWRAVHLVVLKVATKFAIFAASRSSCFSRTRSLSASEARCSCRSAGKRRLEVCPRLDQGAGDLLVMV